jgi:hypothetical protein
LSKINIWLLGEEPEKASTARKLAWVPLTILGWSVILFVVPGALLLAIYLVFVWIAFHIA